MISAMSDAQFFNERSFSSDDESSQLLPKHSGADGSYSTVHLAAKRTQGIVLLLVVSVLLALLLLVSRTFTTAIPMYSVFTILLLGDLISVVLLFLNAHHIYEAVDDADDLVLEKILPIVLKMVKFMAVLMAWLLVLAISLVLFILNLYSLVPLSSWIFPLYIAFGWSLVALVLFT